MQRYHEALKNARTNPKDTWHLLRTKAIISWKIEAKQMQFPEPHHKCKDLEQLFCYGRGERRRETEE